MAVITNGVDIVNVVIKVYDYESIRCQTLSINFGVLIVSSQTFYLPIFLYYA